MNGAGRGSKVARAGARLARHTGRATTLPAPCAGWVARAGIFCHAYI